MYSVEPTEAPFLNDDANAVLQLKALEKENEMLRLQLQTFSYSERLGDRATWWMNTASFGVQYSDNMYRLHGLPPQSLNAHINTFSPFLHPEDRDAFLEAFEQSINAETPLHLQYRIVRIDGKVLQLQLITRWFFDNKGQKILTGLVHNITQEKEQEEKLEQLENGLEFQRQLVYLDEKLADLGHWYINSLTRKTYFSNSCYRMHGTKASAISSTTDAFLNFVHADDQEHVLEAFEKLKREHVMPEIEYRIIRADGKLRYIRQQGKPLVSGNSVIVVGTMQDITIARTLSKKIRSMEEQAEILSIASGDLQRYTNTGTWIWNIDSGKANWSEGLYQILGIKVGVVEASQKHFLRFVHHEDRNKIKDLLNEAMVSDSENTVRFRSTCSGVVKYLQMSCQVSRVSGKRIIVATVRDLTTVEEANRYMQARVQIAEALTKNMTDRCIVLDQDYNVILWNKQCELFYKKKKEEVINLNFFDIFPDSNMESCERDLQHFNRVLSGETVELENLTDKSHNSFSNAQLIPLSVEDGTVWGILQMMRDLTKEIELKTRLSERLQFIEMLVDVSIDRIVVLDRNMNYLYWNKRAEAYYGLQKSAVIGKNILEVFPEFRHDVSYPEFRRALKGETVYIPANGAAVDGNYFETYLIPVKDGEGQLSAILWVVHDYSKELRLGEEQRRALFILDSVEEKCFELDNDCRFKYLNKQAEEYFGKPVDTLINRNIWEAFPELVDSSFYFAIRHCLEERINITQEIISPLSKRWIYLTLTPTEFGVVVLFFNIHERVEANELLRLTTEATPDAVIVFDLESKGAYYLNNRLATWTGHTNEELMDMGFDGRIQLIHPDDREAVIMFNDEIRHADENTVAEIQYRLNTKYGVMWVRNRSKGLKRNPQGEVWQMLTVLQDITEEVKWRLQQSEVS